MVHISFESGKVSLQGGLDRLISFMKLNNLLLGSYNEVERDMSNSLGVYFLNNSIKVISYEHSLILQEDLNNQDINCLDSITEDKYGLFRPLIYNDKEYNKEVDFQGYTSMDEFPGILKYTMPFYHIEENVRFVNYNDQLKYHNDDDDKIEGGINLKELDERIGWNLFCYLLNLKLDFNSLKTLSSLEILFDSTEQDLIAVRVPTGWYTTDPFINVNIKLVERKIVELGYFVDCDFEYTPELFNFRGKTFAVINYYPHCYSVIDSTAKNIDDYLTSSMSHLFF